MKKNLISFVAFLAVAGLCLTSCDKNKTDDPTPTPTETAEMEFVVAVDANQSQYLSQSYEINVNGTAKTFSLSEMTEITDLTKYSSFTIYVDSQYALIEKPENYKLYKYDLGTISTGQRVEGTKKTFTMKTGRPSTAEFDFLDAYTFSTKKLGPVGSHSTSMSGGVYNTDEAVSGICELHTGDMSIFYSL